MEPRQIFLRPDSPAILTSFATSRMSSSSARPAKFDCVLLTSAGSIAKNLDAYQADRAGDSIAINPELFETGYRSVPQVHSTPAIDFLIMPVRSEYLAINCLT